MRRQGSYGKLSHMIEEHLAESTIKRDISAQRCVEYSRSFQQLRHMFIHRVKAIAPSMCDRDERQRTR